VLVLGATAGLVLSDHTASSAAQGDVTISATVLDSHRVRVDWATTRTDITGWNVGRDGVDTLGSGPWATDKAAGDRSHTFNSLVTGSTYTFTLTPKTSAGNLSAVTTTATPGATTPPSQGDVTVSATVLDPNRVRVDWTTTRTDITGWNVGRDGVDTLGSGPWATDKAAGDRSHTFNSLVTGSTYTFTLIPKTSAGNLAAVTTTATPGGGSTTPPPSQGDTAQATQNWGTPAWSDDFNGSTPGPLWGLYDDPGSQHGVRKPENCQVSGGELKVVSEPNLDTCGMAYQRTQTHGRWEARVKSTGSGWKSLFIIWPDPGKWPDNGEYDWREHDAGGACYAGFMHYPNPTNKQERLPDNCASGGTGQWHNVAFEWSSTRLAGWVDGVLWYQLNCSSYGNLCQMPAGHLTIQNDNQGGASGHSALTEVDWVRGWDL
jgi:hypothetical protein